jgi:hypothetical protein
MIYTKKLVFLGLIALFLAGCNGKLPGGDARKFPADPEKRVQQNLSEGRGFKLSEFGTNKGGVFEFASSNELWRASLDVIDFMPLLSVNYSGGVIVTDWYSAEENSNENIKISIRFLSNEVRSDALDIKIFKRECKLSLANCKISENNGILNTELKTEILRKASIYKKEKQKTITSNPNLKFL